MLQIKPCSIYIHYQYHYIVTNSYSLPSPFPHLLSFYVLHCQIPFDINLLANAFVLCASFGHSCNKIRLECHSNPHRLNLPLNFLLPLSSLSHSLPPLSIFPSGLIALPFLPCAPNEIVSNCCYCCVGIGIKTKTKSKSVTSIQCLPKLCVLPRQPSTAVQCQFNRLYFDFINAKNHNN